MENISIIIITYNEEEKLPLLLQSIKKQEMQPMEIIVADANSTDNTVAIARRYGCKIVPGGSSPAEGRNIGAKNVSVKSDILLFLDADIILQDGFIGDCINFMSKNKVEIAVPSLRPDTDYFLDSLLLGAYNLYQITTQFFSPHGTGACIFCTRNLFNKINGFDDSVKHAEDMDFLRRSVKHGRFKVIPGAEIKFSMRRFEEEGRLKMALKNLKTEVYRIFNGEVRDKIVQNKLIKYENRKDWLERISGKNNAL